MTGPSNLIHSSGLCSPASPYKTPWSTRRVTLTRPRGLPHRNAKNTKNPPPLLHHYLHHSCCSPRHFPVCDCRFPFKLSRTLRARPHLSGFDAPREVRILRCHDNNLNAEASRKLPEEVRESRRRSEERSRSTRSVSALGRECDGGRNVRRDIALSLDQRSIGKPCKLALSL